jgi:hypothetical protein
MPRILSNGIKTRVLSSSTCKFSCPYPSGSQTDRQLLEHSLRRSNPQWLYVQLPQIPRVQSDITQTRAMSSLVYKPSPLGRRISTIPLALDWGLSMPVVRSPVSLLDQSLPISMSILAENGESDVRYLSAYSSRSCTDFSLRILSRHWNCHRMYRWCSRCQRLRS